MAKTIQCADLLERASIYIYTYIGELYLFNQPGFEPKKSKIHDPLRCDVHKALVSNLVFFNEIFKNEHMKNKNPPVMKIDTPLKTNMSPENQWLEDVFPAKIVPF